MEATGVRRILVFRILRIAFLAAAGLFFGPLAQEALAEVEIIHIRDDGSGGDCTLVGDWNADTRTCLLTADFGGRFIIDSNGVTLDGDGYTITGTGPSDPDDFVPGWDGGGDGVLVSHKTGVTIKNLNFTRFDYSVELVESSNITVTGVTSSLTGLAGISFHGGHGNLLRGNIIDNPGMNTGICIGYASYGNIVTGNVITNSSRGIYLHTTCTGNNISANTLSGNDWGMTFFEADAGNTFESNRVNGSQYGLYINDRSNNGTIRHNTFEGNGIGIVLQNVTGTSVYQNNFLQNTIQAQAAGTGVNSFSLAEEEGGNYWSDFDTPDEGCVDSDADGLCDAPYYFSGANDARPWSGPDGWLCQRPPLSLAVLHTYWATYDDYVNHLLSVDWEIGNQGPAAAANVTVFDCLSSNGVVLVSPIPEMMGNIPGGTSGDVTIRYQVPVGVASFRSNLRVSAEDQCGGSHYYPNEGPAGP